MSNDLSPPGNEPPAGQVLPVPVIDLGSFQALVRASERVNELAATLTDTAPSESAREHAASIRAEAEALYQLAKQLLAYTQPIDGATGGHTSLDVHTLRSLGVDPLSTQPREQPVPCTVCRESTFNLEARCDLHYMPPARWSLATRDTPVPNEPAARPGARHATHGVPA